MRGTVGSLIKLDVRVKGQKPIEIHWLMDGDEIHPDMTHKTVEEDDLFTLLILEASSMDRGIYEVIAVNEIGEARCQATLDVVPVGRKTSQPMSPPASSPPRQTGSFSPVQIKMPEVLEPLKNTTVHEGKEITFKTRIANTNGKSFLFESFSLSLITNVILVLVNLLSIMMLMTVDFSCSKSS
jgi:hypothetical protein